MTLEQFQEQFQEQLTGVSYKAMMRMYDQYEKTELDWISSMRGAYKKGYARGFAEGFVKGYAKGRAEVKALLDQGVSLEEIKARYGV
jgi:flagellar biosynthesis/type III secretory pathway protein FliH